MRDVKKRTAFNFTVRSSRIYYQVDPLSSYQF